MDVLQRMICGYSAPVPQKNKNMLRAALAVVSEVTNLLCTKDNWKINTFQKTHFAACVLFPKRPDLLLIDRKRYGLLIERSCCCCLFLYWNLECLFSFFLPFAFVNLPVTSGQAAEIGVESRKCLIKSLIYQEIPVFKLCVTHGEVGGSEECEWCGFPLSRWQREPPGEDRARREVRQQPELPSLARALLTVWKQFTG